MSIDGFRAELASPFVGRSERVATAFGAALERIGRVAKVQVLGVDRIPDGPALIVTNHAFGFDAAFPMAHVHRATGRRVWALGEHAFWRFPFVRRLAAAVGTVDGTRENVDALLSRGELVFVLPGGLREAMKPRELRYRLLWGDRCGFVEAAARAQAPIVPLACVGPDELFHLVGDAFARGRRVLGGFFPLPRPAGGIPWPHPSRFTFLFGDPIPPPPIDATTAEIRRCRREVAGAIHELIDGELGARSGVMHHEAKPPAPSAAV